MHYFVRKCSTCILPYGQIDTQTALPLPATNQQSKQCVQYTQAIYWVSSIDCVDLMSLSAQQATRLRFLPSAPM